MARAWVKPSSDGPGFTCFWRDPSKRQRQRTFRLKRDADVFRAKIERDLLTGVYIEAERGAETVAALFERWATSRGLENSSVRTYRSMLNQAILPFFQDRTIGSLKLAQIQEWILWMQDTKHYKPQTIQTRFGFLSSALQWAVANQELGRNPAKGAKLPGRRANVRRRVKEKVVVPSLAEVEALIDAFDPRYVAMIWLMAGCGLRIGEAMGLCLDQIDFRKKLLHVDRQITEDGETDSGKNARVQLKRYTKHRDPESPGRTAPLPKIVADVLRWHLKTHGTCGPDQLLFPNHTRTGLLYQYYFRNRVWLPALQQANLVLVLAKTHALRHFFASSMLSNGVPITDVCEWLGHGNVEVTYEYYRHLMPDAPDRGRTAIDIAMSPLKTRTKRTATGGDAEPAAPTEPAAAAAADVPAADESVWPEAA
ncbi:tyrosine-type recombinase/integrase [Dactylosporangium sp. NPDC000521]|uniref:tyrosine-type recombinase/integrase n=1 Tax=Dactylosporangium sp. NPDC000521 TaxID=3363975 RepID=UPI0036849FAB